MKLVKADKIEGSKYELHISIDKATFDEAVSKAYQKEKGKISVPGFRKGKAPRSIIEKMYGTGVFYETAINDLIPDAYNDAVKIDRIASRVSLERYRENLVYYVNSLKEAGSDVILFSPNPVIEEYFNANPLHPGEDYVEDSGINALVSKYTDIMAEVAREYGVYYFDLAAEFAGKDLYSLINTDGTHPNTKGYTLYATALGDFIQNKYSKTDVIGDINGNGRVDTSDYLICRRIVLGTYNANTTQKDVADVNQNGVIDANDYIRIKRIYLGTYTPKE